MSSATLIGHVGSVQGAVVRVRLRALPTAPMTVDGEMFRIGQIGAFLRIPLGYTDLYGITTQVGADSAPSVAEPDGNPLETDEPRPAGFRWLTLALFGESIGDVFERGVGRYPTVGDEVHVATARDLDTVYGSTADDGDTLMIGRIADAAGIPARLRLSALVSRHAAIFGSTGAGKSNLVAVVLDELCQPRFSSSRIIVIDPHGEYSSAVAKHGKVFETLLTGTSGHAHPLRVPFWALPFDDLVALMMGALQPHVADTIRDRVREMKLAAATKLVDPPPEQAITADTPLPFSLRRLWFDLHDQEQATFSDRNKQDDTTLLPADDLGDPSTLHPRRYPPATPYNNPPYRNQAKLNIGRNLDLCRSRMLDTRYRFMFDEQDRLHPDLDGAIRGDLDELLADWVGGPEPVTVLDVSGVPREVVGAIVGTMLRLIYDALFWAMELPVGGREQPLLVVLDEAHRFLGRDANTPAHRAFAHIAREGRKYGVGLMLVSQRPSDVDPEIASQCGTVIALRVTNSSDREAIAGVIPDDLGGLTQLLPSLRTGEALVLGDALQVPSRVRVTKAARKPVGDDPLLPQAWQSPTRPDRTLYATAVSNWRRQRTTEEKDDA